MNEHTIRTMLEGEGGAAGKALRALLYAPGKAYAAAMRLRRTLYEKGIFASTAATVPVISIGNITAGGSGKTPMTALIANHLIAQGKTPAILLRGYRAKEGEESDEAILYKALCPEALVEVGSDRIASARRATAAGANVLLMDDGFQHLRLRRDLDIVLIDATSPWGGGNCIPGGLLREPVSALKRAQVIILTRADQSDAMKNADTAARIREKIAPPVFLTARHKPARLRVIGAENRSLPLERLRGRRVVVLSGIARPEAFAQTLASLGAEVVDAFTGNDHRYFSGGFVEEALARARELNAVPVTTEKDEAKGLAEKALAASASLWVLGIDQQIDAPAALFAIVDEVAGNQ